MKSGHRVSIPSFIYFVISFVLDVFMCSGAGTEKTCLSQKKNTYHHILIIAHNTFFLKVYWKTFAGYFVIGFVIPVNISPMKG